MTRSTHTARLLAVAAVAAGLFSPAAHAAATILDLGTLGGSGGTKGASLIND